MYLEQLKQDLLSRWKKAFEEPELLQQHKNEMLTEKYTAGHKYDLKDYGTPRFLLPEEKNARNAATRIISDYHLYGFTADGLPCYTSYGHPVNGDNWEGYYTYSDDVVEYVEYCKETKIPSVLKRVLYRNGEKAAYQSLIVNGGGTAARYEEMPKEKVIAEMMNDEYSLICNVETYEIAAGRVLRSDCWAVMPGAGEYRYEEVYRYNAAGELDEIRTLFADGNTRLSYVRLEDGLDVEQLSTELSSMMAATIVQTLVDAGVEQPVSLLEIGYRTVSEYLPLLAARSLAETDEITERHDGEDMFDLVFLSTDNEYLEVKPAAFERIFAQFTQIVEKEENWELGAAMLRRVAYLLTVNKLDKRLKVSDDFAAYAIDWESEMDDFEDILKECGVTGAVMGGWKEKGWL